VAEDGAEGLNVAEGRRQQDREDDDQRDAEDEEAVHGEDVQGQLAEPARRRLARRLRRLGGHRHRLVPFAAEAHRTSSRRTGAPTPPTARVNASTLSASRFSSATTRPRTKQSTRSQISASSSRSDETTSEAVPAPASSIIIR